MFGLQRKRATKAAVDALRPFVGSLSHSHGLPARFWTDAYVLGFFQFMIGHHAKLATNGRIQGEDLGRCLIDALTALSNMNGDALARETTQLALSKNGLFGRGADDAAAMCFYQMHVLKNENEHPLVQRAVQMAGGDRDRSEVFAMMFMASLYQEINARIDPDPA